MADDTQGVQSAENETQQVATPTTEQQTTEPSKEVAGNELPNEASERTKARFDELTNQLREERQRREALEGAFKTLKPEAKTEQDQPIYDPDTGLLNEQALTNVQLRAQEAEKTAQEAKTELQQLKEERIKQSQEIEDMEAYQAHPELNPKDEKFNKDLRDMTASLMLQSMVHPEQFGDKQLTHKEAGDRAKELVAKISGNVKEEAAKEAIEQLSPKEQAALEATGSNKRSDVADISNLRYRTRKGDEDAIVARLKRMSPS
jgi:hypothetical protein